MDYNEHLEKFYESSFNFSYSGINKLLFSPRIFYNHYILNEREDRVDAHLVAGRAIHCLLLENDTFSEQFLITPDKLPTGNNRMIVDICFKAYIDDPLNSNLELEDFKDVILDTLLLVDLHQKLKTDEQRLDKILNESNTKYFEFLKSKGDKTLISQEVYDTCVETIEYIKSDSKVTSLLQLENMNIGVKSSKLSVLNEEFLEMKLGDEYQFGLKGVVDNVVIDYSKKLLFINDLKTTSKPIQDFADSVDYYKYWIQATIYKKLSIDNYLDKDDVKNWKIYVTFIVVDKFNLVYPFQVSEETLAQWEENFKSILEQVNYHYSNKDYSLPYELASGNFKL